MTERRAGADIGPIGLRHMLGEEPDRQVAVDGGSAWRVDWSSYSTAERNRWLAGLPESVVFSTSGSTGRPQRWRRTRPQILAEIEVIRDLLSADRFDGIVSFAPYRHLYGYLFTALLPAVLAVPVRYEPPGPDATCSDSGFARPLFVMIPSAWAVLHRDLRAGMAVSPGTAAVHSTAVLPAAAREMVATEGSAGLAAIELFGSTETGLVAARSATQEVAAPWKLVADVEFSDMALDGGEEPLSVTSARLATPDHGSTPVSFVMDDWVQVRAPRTFTFAGKRTRIVNVNGRRINLDALESTLQAALPCADVACVPTTHATQGEHFELLVVPLDASHLSVPDLRDLVRDAIPPPRPWRIRVVPVIDRSPTGKLRRLQEGSVDP